MKELAIKCMIYVEVDDNFSEKIEDIEEFSHEMLSNMCEENFIKNQYYDTTFQYFESKIEEVDD